MTAATTHSFICYSVEPSSTTVFGQCPLCRRIHHHGHPAGNRPNRVNHCGRGTSQEYRLDVKPGPAPTWLKKAAELPLGDVEIALQGLTTGRQGIWREPSGREIEIPDTSQVHDALRALRACGFGVEADELRDHLRTATALTRRSAKSYWATPQGEATRLRVIATLRRCIATLGGLAPAPAATKVEA